MNRIADLWAEIPSTMIFGVSSSHLLLFFLVLLGIYLFITFSFHRIVARLQKWADKTENTLDNIIVDFIGTLKGTLFFLAFLVATSSLLSLPPFFRHFLEKSIFAIILFSALSLGNKLIDFAAHLLGKKIDGGLGGGFPVFTRLTKMFLWLFALLLFFSNLGFNITSLVAGLGISGIAIALALQKVLEDIFASVSISIDQPFRVGDFIGVGAISGTVENVGIKTTRLRTLGGEEISIPNSTLTNAEIRNFARVKNRRVTISVGVEYGTSEKHLQEIPYLLKSSLNGIEGSAFVRSHFIGFGASSLDFELVFTSVTADLSDKLKRQEKVLYAISRVFSEKGISMAFPSQTIYLKKDNL